MNKNTNKKIIIGFATVLAIFGFAKMAFAATPTVTINPNPSVTTNSASFSVFYNINGDTLTSVAVRYGTNTLMSSNTNSQKPTAISGGLTFSANGLSSGTKYYFQAMGVSSSGTVTSSIYTFTTKSFSASTVQTYPNPSSITDNSAVLSGFFQDNGTSISNLVFQYGTSNSLGSTKSISFSGSSGTVSATISNLSANTKYYYRISGTSAGGTVNGSVYSFTTQNSTVYTNNCVINNFYANNNSVDAGDRVRIYWDTDNCTTLYISGYGNISGDSGSVSVYPNYDTTYTLDAYSNVNNTSRSISVYVNDSVYKDCNYYGNCKDNTNKDCSYYGNCKTQDKKNKKTSNTTYIQAITGVVSKASPTSATLNGSVYSNDMQSFAVFEYGTTPGLGRTTSRLSSNGSYNTNFIYTINNLSPNTTYYFRIVGESNGIVTVGDIFYFKTPSQGGATTVITNTTTKDKSTTSNKNSDIGIGNKNNSEKTTTITNENKNNTNRNTDGSFLAAGAGFSNTFFPGTILGWLVILLFIMILVIVARKLFSNYKLKKVNNY